MKTPDPLTPVHSESKPRRFLTAEWRTLLMLNYAIDPAALAPFVPSGVELDAWQGETYVSMVGFLFQHTRVMGLHIPGHAHFEEVNLRFYVRRNAPEGRRRGVVFIREIVPRRLIAAVARYCYHEPYLALPMRHSVNLQVGGRVEYHWLHQGRWNGMGAALTGPARPAQEGSIEEFITEHYWGYTRRPDGGCQDYQVEHPRWNVWPAADPAFDCDVARLYGESFARPLSNPPRSAFVAEGSPVSVGFGHGITNMEFDRSGRGV